MLAAMPASAETLESALAKAYQGNPSLNASRAGVRAIDENVAIAQSGYRPTVNVNASIGVQYLQTRSSSSVASAGTAGTTATTAGAGLGTTGGGLGGTAGAGTTGTGTTTGIGTTGIGTAGGTTGIGTSGAGAAGSATGGEGLAGGATSDIASQVITSRRTTRTTYLPSSASLNVTQTLFNGFQTDNTVRRAESQVYSQRESLRFTELTVLYNAVQAYMNVLSNTATLELNRNNVEVLEEQLRQTRDRFNVGEVTSRRPRPDWPARGRRSPKPNRPSARASASTGRTSASSRASSRRAARWTGSCRAVSIRRSPSACASTRRSSRPSTTSTRARPR